MRGKYRKNGRRPRTPMFTEAREAAGRVVHNAKVEIKKRDRDVNGVRRQIITFFAEDDIEPALAVEASMSVAAQIYKMPAEGMKRRGLWRFLRLAWRCFRKTRLIEPASEAEG